jgi:hypothetical protein
LVQLSQDGGKHTEIPVNGRERLLQFGTVSGWIGFGGANVIFWFLAAGGGGK